MPLIKDVSLMLNGVFNMTQLDISRFHRRSISGQIEVPKIRERRVDRSGFGLCMNLWFNQYGSHIISLAFAPWVKNLNLKQWN